MPGENQSFEEKEKKLDQVRIARESRGVFGFFVNRPRAAILAVILIVFIGVFATITLPREANPEVRVPVAVITTAWPGAAPGDVEKLVTDEIEKEVESLEHVKLVTSSSSNGLSLISVEFETAADIEESIRKTRDAVQGVSGLPEDALDPEVLEIRFDDLPIATFSLVGDLTDYQLKHLAEDVQDDLDGIPGVSRVEIIGSRAREIEVAVDQGELARLNIPISQVYTAIAQANLDLPAGNIETSGFEYNLRVIGRIEDSENLKKIVVLPAANGRDNVLLGDIARISDQLTEPRSISRIAVKPQLDTAEASAELTARNTVSLQIFKITGGNIIDIVDAAREKLDHLQTQKIIPASVDVVVTNDNSVFVRRDFNTLGSNGAQTLILIFLVLAIALSLRLALIAIISVPLVFLLGLSFIGWQGLTLNSLTLFSLVLSLGLLIDTTIVVLEGVADGLQKGFEPRKAALYAVAIYKWPITSSVLTTIAAFVPMLLVGGITGQFLKTLPLTLSAVLGSSLIIGLLIMPSLAAYFLQGELKKQLTPNWYQRKVIGNLALRYRRIINTLLTEKKSRRRLFAALTILFLASLGLVGSGFIKTELFPEVDIGYLIVNIELPQGTILETTDAKTREVEALIAQIPELDNYVANVGRTGSFDFGSFASGSGSHLANITVNLVAEKKRKLASYEIAEAWLSTLQAVPDAKVIIEEVSGGPPTGSPVELQVLGSDFIELGRAAEQVKKMLGEISGVVQIESSDSPSPPEFVFRLDHEKLGAFGLSASQVATSLRIAIFGSKASTVTLEDEDVDILVKYDVTRLSVDEIRNFEIVNSSGRGIKLAQVADISLEPALQTIRHRNLERVVNITANIADRSAREVTIELNEKLAALDLPADVSIGQSGEFEEEAQAFADLYKAMSLAVLLIFIILVLQFDSYKQPFIILLTLPLAFIGVVVGALVFGLPFGFSTFLGVVALGGIVVNDAIVLIDRINDNLRNRGMEFVAGIAEAGEARLQPIILTTVTTIFGVLPLALTDEFWRGLSVAIAFGIAFATFLTLFLVPVLYQKWERKKFAATAARDDNNNLKFQS